MTPPRSAARDEPVVNRGKGRSIAVPIFLLVLASIIAIALVLFTVTFRGPPPRPAPMRLEAIAAALARGATPAGSEQTLDFEIVSAPPEPEHGKESYPPFTRRMAEILGRPVSAVRLFAYPGPTDVMELRGGFVVAMQLPDGRWRVAETTPPPILTRWHLITLQMMALALAVLGLLAWSVARAISRPLRQLAQAAAGARMGQPLGPMPVGGASEVRDLGAALSTMHSRLSRHAEGRTTMLAAIAHDLGTPLSRLAFRVEHLPDAMRDRALADISEMRQMIASALGFARDDLRAESLSRIDLGSLVESLVDDLAETGAPATVTVGPRAIVRGDSAALRRLFANLIENAIRYGDVAAVVCTVVGETAVVTVDDRGPGIDPSSADSLFEPFVRGEPSRNRATGGTGLGLAIVRSVAARHGGTVTLANGATGARAAVTLPLAG